MPAIDVVDRGCQFIGIGIVNRRDRDKVEGIALRPMFAASSRADATDFAETLMKVRPRTTRRNPRVLRLCVSSGELAKTIRAHKDKPGARLRANRAITSVCALAKIDVSFEANGAAMAASRIGFHRHSASLSFCENNQPFLTSVVPSRAYRCD
jgi:hypothetical protein